PPFRRRAVHIERLLDLLTNPVQYLDHTFGFGQPTFDGTALFTPLKQFLEEIDFPVSLIQPAGQPPVLEAFLFRLSTDPTASPPRLTGRLRLAATTDVGQTFTLQPPWSGSIDATVRFDEGLEASVAPPFAAE